MNKCFTSCCTEECYEKSCKDQKMIIFLIFSTVLILILIAFSTYLVFKPVVCVPPKNKTVMELSLNNAKCEKTSTLTYHAIVAIIEKDSQVNVCIGVAFMKKWILATAHCLSLCSTVHCDNLKVYIESDEHGEIHSIAEFKIHPQFDSQTLQNDICLIRVESFNFKTNDLQLNIKSPQFDNNYSGNVIGWPPISKADFRYNNNILQLKHVLIESYETCRQRIKTNNNRKSNMLHETMMCGIERGCGYVINGAPLFSKKTLLGIAIFSIMNDDLTSYIDVFIDISRYTDFITFATNPLKGNNTNL